MKVEIQTSLGSTLYEGELEVIPREGETVVLECPHHSRLTSYVVKQVRHEIIQNPNCISICIFVESTEYITIGSSKSYSVIE